MAGRTVKVPSQFWHNREVELDPYAPNAVGDDLAAAVSWQYRTALADRGEPPRMFDGGRSDLPPFTASGIPPELLLQIPARCRHAVAAEPDRGQAYSMLQEAMANPEAAFAHPGLDAAVARVKAWSEGPTLTDIERHVRDSAHQVRHAERQQAINQAFEQGGDAAAKALVRQFTAEDQAENSALEDALGSLVGVLHNGIAPHQPHGPMAQPHIWDRDAVDRSAPMTGAAGV